MISKNSLWKELKMENLGQIVSGGTPKTDMPNFWDGNISWITPTDVTALKGKKYISSTKRKISDEGLKNSSANMLPINTLIICTRATIGDSVINKFPISTNQGFKSLIPKPNVSSEYMYYWVSNNKKELIQQSSGSTFLELSTKSFKNLSVLLPPLPEQQKIAEILSTVDEKIEVIEQQIIQTQELKKGLMQRLLTKGIGHTEFKDSPLGMIPESWEVVEVQKISKVIDSLHKTPVFSDKGYPMVRVGDINKDRLSLKNCLKVSEKVLNDFNKNHQPRKGDILMTRVGSFGKTILVDTDEIFCIGQNTVVITKMDNPDFLYQMFNSCQVQKQFVTLTNGSSQPSLSLKDIRHLKILFPPKKEQEEISKILSTIEQKYFVLIEKKEYYQELKKGLMQQLLTGKIRVKV